jgi:hypothetical protein
MVVYGEPQKKNVLGGISNAPADSKGVKDWRIFLPAWGVISTISFKTG